MRTYEVGPQASQADGGESQLGGAIIKEVRG